MLNRPPISMEEDNRHGQPRQLINKGMQGSSYDWMQHNGMESHHSALREEQRGIVEASCVPFSMRDEVCDAVCDGDPKGVGVLTTRTRYSRKRHRHTFCSSGGLLTTSFSNILSFMKDFQPYDSLTIRKPLWRSTIDVPYGSELYCDLDYWIEDYDFTDLYPDPRGYRNPF